MTTAPPRSARIGARPAAATPASPANSTFAGDGGTEFGGDGLAAGRTSLAAPWAVALEGSVLFITDRALYIVWRTEVLAESELIS